MSLAVTVHGASGLVAADRGNTSDPFVIVCLEGGEESLELPERLLNIQERDISAPVVVKSLAPWLT